MADLSFDDLIPAGAPAASPAAPLSPDRDVGYGPGIRPPDSGGIGDEIQVWVGPDRLPDASSGPPAKAAKPADGAPDLSFDDLVPKNPAMADARARVASTPGIVRAISQGASFNLSDEADAGEAALETGARNLLAHTGLVSPAGYGMHDAAAAVEQADREAGQQFAKDHPAQNLGGNILGALGGPGMAKAANYVREAPSLISAIGRSAATGGAFGAAAGAGAGQGIDDRLQGAAIGGATGAVIGGVLPPAVRGVQAAARSVGPVVSDAATMVGQRMRGEPIEPTPTQVANAQGKAVNYVAGLAGAAPSDALSGNVLEQAGRPVLAAEALGRPGVTQLAAVGRRSGQTADTLESTLRQRAQAMPERVLQDLSQATGVAPEAVSGDFAAQAQALRAKAAPLYDAAYSQRPPQNDQLDTLLQRPSMRNAMGRAVNIAREEGRDPTTLGFQFDADGNVTHIQTPSMQTLDYVKRGLDDVLEGYRNPTTGKLQLDEGGRAVLGTLKQFRGVLTNPSTPAGKAYGAALDAGGEPLRLEEAYRAAPKMMGPAVSEATFAQRFGDLSPSQQQAFKGGFVNSLYEGARNGKIRLQDMQQPAFVTKMRAVLGDEPTTQLLTSLGQETQLSRTGARMMPGAGSPTMELAAAEADRTAAMHGLRGAAGKLMQGRPVVAAIQAVTAPVAAAVRAVQSPIDQATRDEVGRLLQLSPSELDKVLKASKVVKAKPQYPASGYVAPASANILASGVSTQTGPRPPSQ